MLQWLLPPAAQFLNFLFFYTNTIIYRIYHGEVLGRYEKADTKRQIRKCFCVSWTNMFCLCCFFCPTLKACDKCDKLSIILSSLCVWSPVLSQKDKQQLQHVFTKSLLGHVYYSGFTMFSAHILLSFDKISDCIALCVAASFILPGLLL